MYIVNLHYGLMGGGGGGTVPIISSVHYNKVEVYAWKCNIGYTANTCNRHRDTQCAYIKVSKLGSLFYLKWFSNYKTYLVPQRTQKFTTAHRHTGHTVV
jgi:hypothetical protein